MKKWTDNQVLVAIFTLLHEVLTSGAAGNDLVVVSISRLRLAGRHDIVLLAAFV